MEKKTSVFNHALVWGAILGIVLIVYSLLLYFMDLSTNRTLSFVSWIIIIIGIFYAMKLYRDSVNQGILSYGNAFVIGLLVSIVAAIISSIFLYIQFNYIAPELIDKIMQLSEEKMLSKGMSEEMIEQSINMSRKFMTPAMMSIWAFIMSVIIGGILSLILAAFVKKEAK